MMGLTTVGVRTANRVPKNHTCFQLHLCKLLHTESFISYIVFFLLSSSSLDIDECEITDICGENGECINTNGSYSCDCHPGYIDGGFNYCQGKDTK